MQKSNFGRWVLGLGGALGLTNELASKQPVEDVVAIEAAENPATEELSQENLNSPEQTSDEPEESESDLARATREIENLPQKFDLPRLKGLPEKLPEFAERAQANPFLDLDHAKEFVADMFKKLHLKCTDRHRHSNLDEYIPANTIGLSFENEGTEEEPYFNVRIDMMSDAEWASLLELTFHPEEERVEIIPDPEIQELVPPLIVSNNLLELQAIIIQYIERVKLARAYALTGMAQEEIKRLLEEHAKKEKEPKQVASAQK